MRFVKVVVALVLMTRFPLQLQGQEGRDRAAAVVAAAKAATKRHPGAPTVFILNEQADLARAVATLLGARTIARPDAFLCATSPTRGETCALRANGTNLIVKRADVGSRSGLVTLVVLNSQADKAVPIFAEILTFSLRKSAAGWQVEAMTVDGIS